MSCIVLLAWMTMQGVWWSSSWTTILVGLYWLVTLDGLFSGICAASGRNAEIRKRWYYGRAALWGMFAAQMVVALGCGAIAMGLVASADKSSVGDDLLMVGQRMLQVYSPYALVVLVTFLLRALPSVDLRSLTSTIGFGPLTLLRPWVIAAGAAWGLWPVKSPVVFGLTAFAMLLMIPLRRVLSLAFAKFPQLLKPVNTLRRELEQELTETDEEAWAYDEMDHRAVNQQFVDDLLAQPLPGCQVVDLGTGTARIPIALCRKLPAAKVMATDFSVPMLDLARRNIEIASLRDRIQLEYCDAKRLPFADQMFDVVISNSLVHHLADPEAMIREAVRVLRPGGLLFVRDLFRPADHAALERLVAIHAQAESSLARAMFKASLHAALTLQEIEQIAARVAPWSQVVISSDRHWTWSGIRPENGSDSCQESISE